MIFLFPPPDYWDYRHGHRAQLLVTIKKQGKANIASVAWGSLLLWLNGFGGEYFTDTHVDRTHKDGTQKEGGSGFLLTF